MNPNSLEVYHRLEDSGKLSALRLKVFKYVCENPGCTSLDCESYYQPGNYSSIAARFGELKEMGLIRVTSQKFEAGAYRDTFEITGLIEPKPLKTVLSMNSRLKICMKALKNIKELSNDLFIAHEIDKAYHKLGI